MKKKIVGICICMLLIITVLPVVKPIQPHQTTELPMNFADGIAFSQIDFYHDNESLINSDWGQIEVNIDELTQQYDEGFLNINHCIHN